MAGFSEAPHFRNHSARRINRFVMQQTRWSPQCTPNCASSRSTAHVATTPWTCGQRPGRNGTSVSSCIAPPLGGTVVFLGCSLGSVRRSSTWFQTLCCTHPTLWLPSSLPSLSPPKVGQRWHVAHLLQLTNEGSRMERGRVAPFISKSHRLFREVLQASVEIGSIYRHRFQFQAKFVPIIVRVLFPSSLGTQSSMEVSVASPSSFVRCRGRC